MKTGALPNFFVIGAAKSGTTSLHTYFEQHPNMVMSTAKEPNFFAFLEGVPDYAGPEYASTNPIIRDRLRREKYGFSVTTWKQYRKLFLQRSRSALAIGESSVCYMYFPEAAQRIKHFAPDASIIAILRNPVDRAYSKYLQLRRDECETLTDFMAALRAEPERIRKNWSPTWFYIDRGFYHRQLAVYFELFGRERIHVALYDDFVQNPQRTLNEMFAFLGLPAFSVNTTERYCVSNEVVVPRSLWLLNLLMRPNALSGAMHRLLPLSVVRAIRPYARRVLLRKTGTLEYTRLTPELRSSMVEIFRDDILQLQDLLGRDLSTWVSVSED